MRGVLEKIINDVRGYLLGNDEFGFREDSLHSPAYPIDLEFTLRAENRFYEPKDSDGIPVREYISVGRQYNPTRVAAYALANYNRYLSTGKTDSFKAFMKAAEWFMRSKDGLWRYEFDWGQLRSPWVSAMAQGEGISVLVRAWKETKDERFLAHAVRALQPLTIPIHKGGVASQLDDGSPFLEEYPQPDPVHVLNGFLYALIGLTDLIHIAGIKDFEPSTKQLILSLERNLREWDLGYWSAYDLSENSRGIRNPATVSYHRLHVTQLSFLGLWWRSDRLVSTARKWTSYEAKLPNRLKSLSVKLMYRIVKGAQR